MAAVNVAKLIGGGVAISLAVNVGIYFLGLTVMGVIALVLLLAYFIKFAYDIELSKLESKNALTKLKELK
jgi:hypothetical protein